MKPAPKEKEFNFNKIIESSREGILIVDTEGIVLFANPAAYILLNRKKNDLIGKSFGQPLADGKAIELGIVRMDDTVGVGEMRLRETLWDGKQAHLVLLLDITELKRMQDDLLKINEELEARVAARTSEIFQYSERLKTSNENLFKANGELERFAYITSHDLQEPLRKIVIYGQMLSGHDDFDPVHKDYIQRMTRSAGEMTHLVDSLLQFSRLPGEFSVEKCDLNQIMKEVVASLQPKIVPSKAVILYSNLATIQANKPQMNHLFQNLIGNAIKFARKDAPLEVTVASVTKDTEIVISVTDNGIGIEAKYRERIFEVFQRLNAKSDYAGSGIGLSIVKKIMENHNGTIRVEPAHPRGSAFILTFPLAAR